MSRRAYLYFAATFLLGVVAGGVGVYFYAWYSGHWPHRFNPQRVVRRLTKDLDLSPEQARQVTQILDEAIKKRQALDQQVEPQHRALFEETNNRIRQILNPAQRAKFDELVRRHEQRMQRRSP